VAKTETGPAAAAAGATTVMEVAVWLVGVATFDPKLTDVAPLRPVPVRITVVPPVVGPLAGAMLAMYGP
jgi:hypothetical protein